MWKKYFISLANSSTVFFGTHACGKHCCPFLFLFSFSFAYLVSSQAPHGVRIGGGRRGGGRHFIRNGTERVLPCTWKRGKGIPQREETVGWQVEARKLFLPRTKRVSRRRRKIKNISFPVRFALRWVMGAGEELCNFFALRIIMVRQKPKRKWPPTTGGKKASPRQSSRLFLAVLYSGNRLCLVVSLCVCRNGAPSTLSLLRYHHHRTKGLYRVWKGEGGRQIPLSTPHTQPPLDRASRSSRYAYIPHTSIFPTTIPFSSLLFPHPFMCIRIEGTL